MALRRLGILRPLAVNRSVWRSASSGHAKEQYSEDKETHFGYENVSESKKAEKVHGVFENVAEKYDLMNDLMSGGIHRLWKDSFISTLGPRPNTKLLDVAGGTGDIAFRFIDHVLAKSDTSFELPKAYPVTPEAATDYIDEAEEASITPYKVVICDISQGMLDIGQKRAEERGLGGITWVCGDAQELPFEDDTFDCYTIAFGIRNVIDVQSALEEAYRVLKPGGRFLCLEFSQVTNPAIKWMYDQYSFQIIPAIGQVVAGDWKSYQYLVESIRKFPSQEEFKEMIEEAGFRRVTFENLTFGVTAIHSGFKI